MQRRNAKRNIGRAKVYFMYWNSGVKIRELFQDFISVVKISSKKIF